MQLHLTIEELELLRWLVNDENRLSCDATIESAQLSAQPFFAGRIRDRSRSRGQGIDSQLAAGFLTNSKSSLTSSPGARIS
jgi:hypothetical protein